MPLPPTPPPPRRPSRPISRVSGRAPPPPWASGEGVGEGLEVATPPSGPSPTLESFEIVRSLGRGSRGEVLEVRRLSDGSRFALKRSLRPLSGPAQRRHWLRECHAQRGAGPAPGLLPLLAAWEQRGHFHLLTPLCPAGSLGHLWRKGARGGVASPPGGVASFFRGVVSALKGVAWFLRGVVSRVWRETEKRGGALSSGGVASSHGGVASPEGGVGMAFRGVVSLWRGVASFLRGGASLQRMTSSPRSVTTPPDASSPLANEHQRGVAKHKDSSPLANEHQRGVAEHKDSSPLANEHQRGVAKPKDSSPLAKPPQGGVAECRDLSLWANQLQGGVADPKMGVAVSKMGAADLKMGVADPEMGVADLKMGVSSPSPAISDPWAWSEPSLATPTPSLATSVPSLTTPTPSLATPTPSLATPTPSLATSVPSLATPTPSLPTPTPCPAPPPPWPVSQPPSGRPLAEWRLRGYLWDLLVALSQLHARPLAHGDVKPDNVLLDASGRCRLADFGLAAGPGVGEGHGGGGAGGGDPRYVAPEGLVGEGRPPGDIFSLGLSVAELAGHWRLPGEGEGWRRLRSGGGGRLPPGLGEGLSPELRAVLAAMLDPEPRLRPSAAELLSWGVLRGAGRWRPLTRLADLALRRLEDWLEAVPALCSSLRGRFGGWVWGPRTPPRPPRADPWSLRGEEEEEEGAPERGEGRRSPSPTPDPRRTLTFDDDDDDDDEEAEPLPPPP